MPDPIHQFEIKRLIPIDFLGFDLTITNSALFMGLSIVTIFAFFMVATRNKRLVPTRLQSIAETIYEFVLGMVRDSMGEQGLKFFPLVFTLFLLILTLNMYGMVPGFFTVTSQLWITAALALLVFLTVIVVGFVKNGAGFLKLFVPEGVPIYVLPLVSMIEVISFFSRPLSHSVRLFANMLAGHITLKVFAGFIIMLLGAAGLYKTLAVLPLFMAIALTALEFLVAFLQAYVFTMLTCMYLNDALHPSH
ncbi:MAG: F0F1 ATP synthase subunit A [Hyphomicrobium sp.]